MVQALLQFFLLNTMLVTLWANPNWRGGRGIVFGIWLVSLAGSALALAPLPVEWHRLGRTAGNRDDTAAAGTARLRHPACSYFATGH